MNDEQAEQGREQLRSLRHLKQQREEAEECIQIAHPKLVAKKERLRAKRAATLEELDASIKAVDVELREVDPDMYKAIEDLDTEIATAEKKLKAWGKGLPDELLKSTQKLQVDGAALTVSKVQLHVVYDEEALLKEIPELYNLSVDGDKAVIEALNVPVVERLLADETIDPDIVKKYRTIERSRAPSVTIKITELED